MTQKLLADDREWDRESPCLLFSMGWDLFSKWFFFVLFLPLPLSITIASIIISYFLKIVELRGNSQKRNKANKMEKGRTLPERLTQWCGSGQSCWVWPEFGDTGRTKYRGAYNWTSREMLHFNGIPDWMAPPFPPGACIDEETPWCLVLEVKVGGKRQGKGERPFFVCLAGSWIHNGPLGGVAL